MQNMSKTPDASIVMIPRFRAVASGFHEMGKFFAQGGPFGQVMSMKLPVKSIMYECEDFLLRDGGDPTLTFNYIRAVQDSVTQSDVSPYELIDFSGGLYATATTIDNDMESMDAVTARIKSWIETSGFVIDENRGHRHMTQMIYVLDEVKKGLGYDQLQIYIPIKLK